MKQKIAVFRVLQLGDILCAVPALRALRHSNPNAQITLIGLPWAATFAKRFSSYIDSFTAFPGFPGIPEQPYDPLKIISFIQQIQREEYDLLIQLHGDGSIINPLMFLFGAKKVAGFFRDEDYCPDPALFLEYPEKLSEIERLLALMDFLHIPLQGNYLEFPISENEERIFLSYSIFRNIISKHYICIHPGARDKKRRWNPLFFAHIADKLASIGYTVVITGEENEKALSTYVANAMEHKAIDVTGQTSLPDLALLLRNAKLLVSNCTAVSHIADALHVPSITVYLASDPKRWAPQDTFLHRQIDAQNADNIPFVLHEAVNLLKRTAIHSPLQKGESYETQKL